MKDCFKWMETYPCFLWLSFLSPFSPSSPPAPLPSSSSARDKALIETLGQSCLSSGGEECRYPSPLNTVS